MKRLIKIILFILCVFILQMVILPKFTFLYGCPDLFLVSVILFALLQDENETAVFSSACGFIQDLICMTIYFYTITKLLTGFLVNLLKERIIIEDENIAALLFVLIFSVLSTVAQNIYAFFMVEMKTSITYVLCFSLLSLVYNLAVTPLLFVILKRVVYD